MATCIEELIATNILTQLTALVTAGTAHDAYRPLRGDLPESPANNDLILLQDDPTEPPDSTHGHKTWIQRFYILCVCRPSDISTVAVDAQRNDLRAAVEKKLRADPSRAGYAMDTNIRAPLSFALGEAYSGIIVVCEVLYRTLEDDPYTGV